MFLNLIFKINFFFFLQYFFTHKKAPPIKNELDQLNLNEIKFLRDYPKDALPYIWDKYLHPQSVSEINFYFIVWNICQLMRNDKC